MGAKLKKHCTCALFVPCLAHSLNHVIGETAGCVIEATDYFQFLQELYTFFASSTHLYTVLLTEMWSNILVRCNETSKSLQSDSLPLDVALKLVGCPDSVCEGSTRQVRDLRSYFETDLPVQDKGAPV
ncbi:hypothetical protein RI129_013125 [Pyrocoelia pectoralis]|uniref:Uncharacterized protein n=1 Tax=Pyrocoelia pectoralis TaxID=417401 RepID=A0AAN7UVL5_9COLE